MSSFVLADPKSFYLYPPEDEDYGFPFKKLFPYYSQAEKELYIYSILKGDWGAYICRTNRIHLKTYGFYSVTQHLINAINLIIPNQIDLEINGYRNTNTLKVLDVLCRCDDVGISGNALSGKSFPAAAWIWIDWLSTHWCTSTFIGTTTVDANKNRIWGRICHFFKPRS